MDGYTRFTNIGFVSHKCGHPFILPMIKTAIDKSRNVVVSDGKTKIFVLIYTDSISRSISRNTIKEISDESKKHDIDFALYDFNNGKYNIKVIRSILDANNKDDKKVVAMAITSMECFKITSDKYIINYKDDILEKINDIAEEYEIPIIVGEQIS